MVNSTLLSVVKLEPVKRIQHLTIHALLGPPEPVPCRQDLAAPINTHASFFNKFDQMHATVLKLHEYLIDMD